MKQKTKDNLIYVGVGLTIALGFATYMLWSERITGTIPEMGGPILNAFRWNPPVIMWSIITVPWFTIVIIVAGKLINPKRSRVPQR